MYLLVISGTQYSKSSYVPHNNQTGSKFYILEVFLKNVSKAKKGNAWKYSTSIFVKVNGEWKSGKSSVLIKITSQTIIFISVAKILSLYCLLIYFVVYFVCCLLCCLFIYFRKGKQIIVSISICCSRIRHIIQHEWLERVDWQRDDWRQHSKCK